MRTFLRSSIFKFSLLAVLCLSTLADAWAQSTFKVLHTFAGGTSDGQWPPNSLILDKQGNLYGTTSNAGLHGYGTVFKLTPSQDGTWSESIIYDFCHNRPVCTDGAYPLAGVTFDQAGNIYGTTSYGGSAQGWGTVYQLTPNSDGTWTQTVLWHLPGTMGSSYPAAAVTFDNAGHMFGTALGNPVVFGLGNVFELTKSSGAWQRRVLYSFMGGADGADPVSPVVIDKRNNLYGITVAGGVAFNAGVVFQLVPNRDGSWTEKVILDLDQQSGSGSEAGGVILDAAGNLYGTADKNIFELTPGAGGWKETILYTFGLNEGSRLSGLVFDQAGNLYGTAGTGGRQGCANGYGCGSVFKLTPNGNGSWTKSTLYSFTGGADGGDPIGGVILDSAGNLYGATQYGGDKKGCITLGCGVIYEITP